MKNHKATIKIEIGCETYYDAVEALHKAAELAVAYGEDFIDSGFEWATEEEFFNLKMQVDAPEPGSEDACAK